MTRMGSDPAGWHILPITDRAAWDAALLQLPRPHVLQTWDWGAFKERWGWQATRWLWIREGRPVAAAQLLRRRLGRLPLAIVYVPKGPLFDIADLALWEVVLAELEGTARRGVLFVKIDPDVPLNAAAAGMPPPDVSAIRDLLRRRGWRLSAEQIQFKNTVWIDLSADEDTLLAALKPKTRYNIRLAARRGVTVRPGGQEDLAAFYRLYRITAQRDGFVIRPFPYYRDVWAQFLAAGRAHLLLAELEGQPIAGLLMFVFGPTAWYMYGASDNAHREMMPNHLLQWEAIRLARQLGCTRYDMWGAPDRLDASDPMWGVYRFKVGFGGRTVLGLGACDFTAFPAGYYLYTVVMPRLLAFMRLTARAADDR
jgi:lipid II:glycine glycyltransferase (peptidoglycan interpeptide bridge formation enzyme)